MKIIVRICAGLAVLFLIGCPGGSGGGSTPSDKQAQDALKKTSTPQGASSDMMEKGAAAKPLENAPLSPGAGAPITDRKSVV